MPKPGEPVWPEHFAYLPMYCFAKHPLVGCVCIKRGVSGYTFLPGGDAEMLNRAMGITKAQEAAMLAGCLYGWHLPLADPRLYTKNGGPRGKEGG
jgi:hypothetical protein